MQIQNVCSVFVQTDNKNIRSHFIHFTTRNKTIKIQYKSTTPIK